MPKRLGCLKEMHAPKTSTAPTEGAPLRLAELGAAESEKGGCAKFPPNTGVKSGLGQ